MDFGGIARPLIAMILAVTVGCTLLVDTSEIDGGCGTGRKVCDGRCVEIDDPAFGCSPVSNACDPCERRDNAKIDCNPTTNACETVGCVYPFIGCGQPLTSCEIQALFDPENCGGCHLHCLDGARCSQGLCCPADGGACVPGTLMSGAP
jgi:hypothetical protein